MPIFIGLTLGFLGALMAVLALGGLTLPADWCRHWPELPACGDAWRAPAVAADDGLTATIVTAPAAPLRDPDEVVDVVADDVPITAPITPPPIAESAPASSERMAEQAVPAQAMATVEVTDELALVEGERGIARLPIQFRSERSASGFARQLERVSGGAGRVVALGGGRYTIDVGWEDGDQKRRLDEALQVLIGGPEA